MGFTSVENHFLPESEKIDIRRKTYYSDVGELQIDALRNYVFAFKKREPLKTVFGCERVL